MSEEQESERYLKDPSLLTDLLLEVIERLDEQHNESEAKMIETQLKEVAKAIGNLEKVGVVIPDALRAEKTRLAVAQQRQAQSLQALQLLNDEPSEITQDLRNRLGQNNNQATEKKPRSKRSKMPKTDKSTLRQLIIEALESFGGSAHKNDVLHYMEQKLQSKLLPGDLERRESTKDLVWQNNACWERFRMVEDGILKTNSPRGIWELNKDYHEIQ